MKIYRTWALSCMTAAVLSACTTMDTSRPDQMYRQAVMKNLNQDNQYNFSGETTLKWQENQTQSTDEALSEAVAADAASEAALAAEVAALTQDLDVEVAVGDDDENMAFDSQEVWDEITSTVIEAADSYPVVHSFMKHSALKVDGAMDLKQGKLEMVPSMKIGTGNYSMWAQLPIHIDGKNEVVLVDAQGYAGWFGKEVIGADIGSKGLQMLTRLENGALLELKAPNNSTTRYPIQTGLRSIPKGLEQYLNAIDAKNFTLAPMNDYGRSLGAAYRVQLNYDTVDSIKWYDAFLKGYKEEFERLQKEEPEAGVTEEAYEQIQSLLLLSAMMMGNFNTDSETCSASDEAKAECLAKEKELREQFKGMPKLNHSLYLSRNGRILGVQDDMVIKHPEHKRALVYTSSVKLHNYGRPKFSMNVNQREKVSIWDIIGAPNETRDAEDAMVDDEAAAAAEAEAAMEAALATIEADSN